MRRTRPADAGGVGQGGQWLKRDTEASDEINPILYALAPLSLDKDAPFRLTLADTLLCLAGNQHEYKHFTGDILSWQPLVKSPLAEQKATEFRLQMLYRLAEDPRCQLCTRGQDAIWQDEQAQAWAQQQLKLVGEVLHE